MTQLKKDVVQGRTCYLCIFLLYPAISCLCISVGPLVTPLVQQLVTDVAASSLMMER